MTPITSRVLCWLATGHRWQTERIDLADRDARGIRHRYLTRRCVRCGHQQLVTR